MIIQPFTFAQWTPTNGPFGGILSTFLADGLTLFTTTNSEVYLSADSGSNWVSISNGLPDFLYRITAFAVQDTFLFIIVNYNFGELYRTGSALSGSWIRSSTSEPPTGCIRHLMKGSPGLLQITG